MENTITEEAYSILTGATSSNGDGTSTVSLSTDLSAGQCVSNDYIAYDPSMSIDTSQCRIVSYGGPDTKLCKSRVFVTNLTWKTSIWYLDVFCLGLHCSVENQHQIVRLFTLRENNTKSKDHSIVRVSDNDIKSDMKTCRPITL